VAADGVDYGNKLVLNHTTPPDVPMQAVLEDRPLHEYLVERYVPAPNPRMADGGIGNSLQLVIPPMGMDRAAPSSLASDKGRVATRSIAATEDASERGDDGGGEHPAGDD
jgi:hypothetical protein